MEKDQDKSFVAAAQLQLLDKTVYKTPDTECMIHPQSLTC